MKKKLIVIGVILLVAISAIGLLKMRKAALAKASPPAVLPVVVDAVTLLPQRVTLTLPAMGVVSSDISTTLSTKVSGRVVKVSKREGDAVKKGDLLIRIDARELRAQKENLASQTAKPRFRHHRKAGESHGVKDGTGKRHRHPCPD